MIPEDTTILNSSLSSSLSSLCAARDLESAKTAGEVSVFDLHMHTHSHVHVVITQIVGSFIQDAHNMDLIFCMQC